MTSTCGAAALESNAAGQRTIVVAAKVFADAPRPQDDPRRRSLEAREPPEEAARATDFVFSDVTAARYKEYAVIKVNKRGVRQERVLGIDRERFYNIARSGDAEAGAEGGGGGGGGGSGGGGGGGAGKGASGTQQW